jgi:hypothetical protein
MNNPDEPSTRMWLIGSVWFLLALLCGALGVLSIPRPPKFLLIQKLLKDLFNPPPDLPPT